MRDFCANCGARIKPRPVDGTDPADAENGWYEIYECENGCTGRLFYEPGQGTTTTGAIDEGKEAIA